MDQKQRESRECKWTNTLELRGVVPSQEGIKKLKMNGIRGRPIHGIPDFYGFLPSTLALDDCQTSEPSARCKKNGESNLELLDGQCQSWASHWCRSVLLWIVGSIVAWMITCFARENVVWKHKPCRPLSHEPAYLAGLNHIQSSLRILNEGIFATMTHRCSYESWPFAKWLKLQIQYAGIVHGTFLKVARTTGETFRAPG